MPEYAKMKNADLEALLKERGLPTGGKKADMVERLTNDDEKKAAAAAPAPSKLHPEDEIDWDDEGEDGPTEAAKAAPTTSSEKKESKAAATAPTTESDTTANPNPQAVPNQKADIDPSQTDDLAVKSPAEQKEGSAEAESEEKEPAPSYTKGLAATDMEKEIEKRKARALKFGLKPEDDEGLKMLERAKKFGMAGPPKGLDEALPERRKRGREDNQDSGRNKRRGGGRFGGRGRGGHRDGDRRRDNRDSRREDRSNTNGGSGTWMSEADRKKAEERKAKWAKPAAA